MRSKGYISIFIVATLLSFSSQAADYVAGEIIVKMKDNASDQQKHQFVGKASLSNKMSLKKSWTRFNMHQFRLKPGQSVENAINEALLDPSVEYAEPNYIFHKQSVGIEGEPLNSLAVHELANVEGFAGGSDYGQAGSTDIMNVEGAWAALSSSGSTPVVAVIDSGVDYNHEVFASTGAIWSNADEIPGNGIDDDGNGYIDDVRGWNFVSNTNDPMDDDNHGTHVAGIILGMTQNIFEATIGTGSAQPAVIKIMPLKFLDSNGSGSTSDAIEAINYAINNGAHILNNSWGGGGHSQALEDAAVTAYNQGRTFVAAAGNAANDNDASPTYPASYSVPNIVSIAATESNDYLASFSNYGNQSVHVGSPGVYILSTLPNDSYGYSSGTSMAAPISAGLAALLMYEAGTSINGFQMKSILAEQSHAVNDLVGKVSSASRVDALRALSYVQGNPIDDYQPDYTSASRSLSSTSAAGGCGMVSRILNKYKGQGGGKPPWGTTALLLGILFAPLMLVNYLKRRHQRDLANRRQFPRYKIDSAVTIAIGGKQLTGQVSSISLGGARIDTEAMLEDGGIVTMSIASPDGQQQIEVQGRVVWSEESKAYGVKFCDAKDDAIAAIGGWTKKLAKVS